MGKRLDQLGDLDDGPGRRDELTESRDAADRFVEQLRELEDDPRYEFCWGMLVDMRVTVQQTGRVTEGQRQAIDNVLDGVRRHDEQAEGWRRHERRTGRRYEGWDPRRHR
jgi:hypothetical protein